MLFYFKKRMKPETIYTVYGEGNTKDQTSQKWFAEFHKQIHNSLTVKSRHLNLSTLCHVAHEVSPGLHTVLSTV